MYFIIIIDNKIKVSIFEKQGCNSQNGIKWIMSSIGIKWTCEEMAYKWFLSSKAKKFIKNIDAKIWRDSAHGKEVIEFIEKNKSSCSCICS